MEIFVVILLALFVLIVLVTEGTQELTKYQKKQEALNYAEKKKIRLQEEKERIQKLRETPRLSLDRVVGEKLESDELFERVISKLQGLGDFNKGTLDFCFWNSRIENDYFLITDLFHRPKQLCGVFRVVLTEGCEPPLALGIEWDTKDNVYKIFLSAGDMEMFEDGTIAEHKRFLIPEKYYEDFYKILVDQIIPAIKSWEEEGAQEVIRKRDDMLKNFIEGIKT